MSVRVLKRGFTLVEILTAIVVIAVLVAVAVPTWQRHVLRTQRTSAKEMLSQVQIAQEAFFGRNARYATADELSQPVPAGLGLSSLVTNYRLSLETAADGLAFTVTARTTAQSTDTYCVAFTIDQVGLRTATDASGADRSADCWR